MRRLLAYTHSLLYYLRTRLRLERSPHASLVLRYHSVGPREEIERYVSPGIGLEPERFDEHVRFLKARYDVIDLDEAVRRTAEGRGDSCRPGVVITFDDGYRDNFDHVLPVLRRHSATATVYVVAGCVRPAPAIWTVRLRDALVGAERAAAPCPLPLEVRTGADRTTWNRAATRHLRGLTAEAREEALTDLATWAGGTTRTTAPVMMDTAEIRGMIDGGVTIGAHTLTHPLLTAVPADEAAREIAVSRSILEDLTEAPVLHFSYPNPGSGAHENPQVRGLAREAGYRTAATSHRGLVGRESDPFGLERVGINAGLQERLLFRALGARG